MKSIRATLTCDRHGAPLAVVDLPGDGAELRPQELRELADTLLRIASAAERRKLMHRGKPLPPQITVHSYSRPQEPRASRKPVCIFSPDDSK